jgi:hypothetical protein
MTSSMEMEVLIFRMNPYRMRYLLIGLMHLFK